MNKKSFLSLFCIWIIFTNYSFSFGNKKNHLHIGYAQFKGLKKTKLENRYKIIKNFDGRGSYYVSIFDGYNGPEAAEYASQHLHKQILKKDYQYNDPTTIKFAMEKGFLGCDVNLRKKKKITSGTAAATLIITKNHIHVGHVGNFHALICQSNKVIPLITKHHTIDEKEELKRIKKIVGGGYISNIIKNFTKLQETCGETIYTRSLGNRELKQTFQNYNSQGKEVISASPETSKRQRYDNNDEFIIIATKNVCNKDNYSDIVGIVRAALLTTNKKEKPAKKAAETVLKALLKAFANDGITNDDMTVIVIQFKPITIT